MPIRSNFEQAREELSAIVLPENFPLAATLRVAKVLEQANICVPGYVPPAIGMYDVRGFLYENTILGLETTLLPDRNIVSRIVQMAMGRTANDAQYHVAAALIGFSQCMDIVIDPSIAMHELAFKNGNDAALAELAWFRAADNCPAQQWLSIALQRRKTLKNVLQPQTVEPYKLDAPLSRWRRNYVLALKLAELERHPLTPLERMLGLLEWMHKDFILGGPAAILASIYFAPRSPPREGLIKRLRSPNRQRAVDGVRNAAWDLTHLSDFVRRSAASKDGNQRVIFASLDRSLALIARLVLGHSVTAPTRARLADELSQWWTNDEATLIAETLATLYSKGRSKSWYQKQSNSKNVISDLTEYGESVLLSPWSATIPRPT